MAGKPRHKVTEKTKAEVKALASFGTPQESIALYLGISVDTLDRRYRYELDTGPIHATAQVAGKLFKKAVEENDLTAQIFWLKTRGRWRTADNERIVESNEDLRKELLEHRERLKQEYEKEY